MKREDLSENFKAKLANRENELRENYNVENKERWSVLPLPLRLVYRKLEDLFKVSDLREYSIIVARLLTEVYALRKFHNYMDDVVSHKYMDCLIKDLQKLDVLVRTYKLQLADDIIDTDYNINDSDDKYLFETMLDNILKSVKNMPKDEITLEYVQSRVRFYLEKIKEFCITNQELKIGVQCDNGSYNYVDAMEAYPSATISFNDNKDILVELDDTARCFVGSYNASDKKGEFWCIVTKKK